MVSIARRNLFHERTRFLISMGGVAFSIFLMLYFLGIFNGFEYLLEGYVENQDVDIWVVEEGKTDFFRGSSRLPTNLTEAIAAHAGVKEVNRIVSLRVMTGDDKNQSVIIIGYNTRTGVGGPWKIVEGKSIPNKGEIIIDRVFSKKHNVKVGEMLEMMDEDFRVVGISDLSSVLLWQYAFINYDEVERMFNMENYTNYITIKLDYPEFDQSIINSIKDSFNVNAFSKLEFKKNNKQLIREGFIPILSAVLIIGILVGTAFVAVTIYTVTIEKIKEYGILKALGASKTQLYRIIFEQSLISSIIGFFVGSMLTVLAVTITYYVFPEIVAIIELNSFIYMLIASIIISLIASYMPIKKVSEVDPVIIFR